MVRVISQNFSPPRSRHSSGETDRDLAERASFALGLSAVGRKRLDIPDYESSSDSFLDSEWDGDTLVSENSEDINGNENHEKSDVQSKRKERRRERNKLSAKAYRQRRRNQNVKEQQELYQLEAENKRLHTLVETLEKKTEEAKRYLRGNSVPMPDVLLPSGAVGGAGASADADITPPLTPRSMASPIHNMNKLPDYFHPPVSHYEPSHHHHNSSKLSPPHTSPCSSQGLPSPPPPPFASTVGENSQNQISILVNGSAANLGAYSPQVQQSPPTSPVPGTKFVINANSIVSVGACTSFTESSAFSTSSGPTVFAIPVENQHCFTNKNLNCNPLRTSPSNNHASTSLSHPSYLTPVKAEPTPASAPPTVPPTATPLTAGLWLNINGNPVQTNGNGTPGTVFSLVNMEMCNASNLNSNNNNNNISDSNGNTSCDNRACMQPNANIQPVSFNYNHHQ